MLHFRNLKWLLGKCKHPNTTQGPTLLSQARRPRHGCSLRPCLVPSGSSMAWYPPPLEPFSKLLIVPQCSVLNAPFAPVRSSSHFYLPRALPQFLHLQLASFPSSFHGGLIMSLIPPHLDSLWCAASGGQRALHASVR